MLEVQFPTKVGAWLPSGVKSLESKLSRQLIPFVLKALSQVLTVPVMLTKCSALNTLWSHHIGLNLSDMTNFLDVRGLDLVPTPPCWKMWNCPLVLVFMCGNGDIRSISVIYDISPSSLSLETCEIILQSVELF